MVFAKDYNLKFYPRFIWLQNAFGIWSYGDFAPQATEEYLGKKIRRLRRSDAFDDLLLHSFSSFKRYKLVRLLAIFPFVHLYGRRLILSLLGFTNLLLWSFDSATVVPLAHVFDLLLRLVVIVYPFFFFFGLVEWVCYFLKKWASPKQEEEISPILWSETCRFFWCSNYVDLKHEETHTFQNWSLTMVWETFSKCSSHHNGMMVVPSSELTPTTVVSYFS